MALRYGKPPFLECSSDGDRRFSAFFARIKRRDNATIEQIYQESKEFSDAAGNVTTGHSIKEAKGLRPSNAREVRKLYATLWDEYIEENPDLIPVLVKAPGVSDRFGRRGSVCQATELWRIRNDFLNDTA